MRSIRHLLPSAGSLFVFEAAGRHLSFTQAGRELGMSQAAVSYAIRKLEDQLGIPLFRREHRRVRLTDAGDRFLTDVTLGLSHIRKSAEDLRSLADDTHVTLSASTAFAAYWMMPRLQQLRRDLPGIDLRIQTSDRDIDLVSESIPLGIRCGVLEDWPEYDAWRLDEEEIYAVAGSAYAAQNELPTEVAAMIDHQLIDLEEPYRPAANWASWFASAGINSGIARRGLLINDYVLIIQAVLEGQGIALGWRHLIEPMISAGLVVRVTDHVMRTGLAYYIVWPKNRSLSPSAARVREWLSVQT